MIPRLVPCAGMGRVGSEVADRTDYQTFIEGGDFFQRWRGTLLKTLLGTALENMALEKEETYVGWRVRAIRGATTATSNSVEAIRDAVTELLVELEHRNQFDFDDIVSATFSVTRDLDAIFPAAIARQRSQWANVPLLDVQQMHVEGSLERCIRLMIHINAPAYAEMHHTYLRGAAILRPDLSMAPATLQS